MLNEKIFKKLTKVIGEDAMANLQDLSIYQDDEGYHLFNQYVITKKNNAFEIALCSALYGHLKQWDNEDYLNVILPEARIYNRALLATEILNNYNSIKGRFV
jgi:hypothetical protein